MAISTTCQACGRTYKVEDKWAGKKLKCRECGAVMQVPGGAPAAARPRGTQRQAEDDPFDNVDSLRAIEQSGEIEDEDPRVIKQKLRALRRQREQQAAGEVDDRVGAAVERRKSVKKVGPQRLEYKSPDGLMFVDEAYFTIPGEEQIDKWAPMISIGLFVLAILSPIFLGLYALTTRPEGTVILWGAVFRGIGIWLLITLAICFFVLVIMGGLASVGVLVAAAIMKFPKPSGVFKKCAAALSFPMMLHLLIAGIASAAGTRASLARGGGGVPAVWWALMPFLIIGMLWLLLRLKPAPFGLAAGLSLALGVGLPLLILLIIGMATGIPAGTLLAGGPRPAGVGFGGGAPPPGRTTPPRTFPNPQPRANPAPAPQSTLTAETRTQAEQRLKKIYDAMIKYATANGGRFQTNLRDLLAHGLTEEDLRTPWNTPWNHQYVHNTSGQPSLPPQVILVHDSSFKDNQRVTLFGDGRVEWIEPSKFGEASMSSAKARADMMRARPR